MDWGARLDELAREHRLVPSFAGRMRTVLRELEVAQASLTTVRDPRDAVERHVADSLSGLVVDELRHSSTLADLGAGGGFPGLALAAALPTTTVTLVESVSRKCAFLERVTAAAGFVNVRVVCGRAESWSDGLESQEVITARALAPLAVLVEYAAPLLVRGGVAVCWKGSPDAAEVDGGAAAAAIVGMEPDGVLQTGANGSLYVYRKVEVTPARFPRREGIARKRPLAP